MRDLCFLTVSKTVFFTISTRLQYIVMQYRVKYIVLCLFDHSLIYDTPLKCQYKKCDFLNFDHLCQTLTLVQVTLF